jgi:hypothetical protein
MRGPIMLPRESEVRDRFHRWQHIHALCVPSNDPRLN